MKRTVVAARRIAKRKTLRKMQRGRNPFFGAQGPRGPKDPKDLRGAKGVLLREAEEQAQARKID
ncbi:MAG TPA: hypothetical protein VKW09_02020 [bacterium]|nr:hypothetical protein [bacterium]